MAIKKIGNAFANRIDAKRTLREIKILRHMNHENVCTFATLDFCKAVSNDRKERHTNCALIGLSDLQTFSNLVLESYVCAFSPSTLEFQMLCDCKRLTAFKPCYIMHGERSTMMTTSTVEM